jgi:hypothetical protein
MDPLLVHDPRSSIGYMVAGMTNLHAGFVRTRALPFAHPRLYSASVPKTMLAAFCGASAYASRTPETKGWAYKAVQEACAEVRREGSLASSPLEKLARCHALLVLETIRVFDGDMGLRFAAERELGTLRDWSLELPGIVREMSGGRPLARDHPPSTWDVRLPPLPLSPIYLLLMG